MAPTKKVRSKHSGFYEVKGSRPARFGMVLMDMSLKPLAVDRGAASILTESSLRDDDHAPVQIPDEVLEFVRNRSQSADLSSGEAHFRSGKFEYVCRAYLAEPQNGVLSQPVLALHFERGGAASDAIHKVAVEYRLTDREEEALRGISLGLTSKELAERMSISPNTVRAFLRLIMIKMDVTTRAGVVAKILDYTRVKGA